VKRQPILFLGVLCLILTGCRTAALKNAVPAAPTPPSTAPQGITRSPSGPPLIPSGPLGDLDQLFIDSYTSSRSEFIRKAPPFIVISGSNLILHRNGQKDDVRVIPDLYHALKDIAHLPFTVYLQLSPLAASGTPLTDAKAAQLQSLLTRILTVQGVLATGGYTPNEMARQTEILDGSQALVSSTLKNNRVDRKSLDVFTHQMGPLMLLNASDAACLQIQGTHAQMMKWKEALSADEWQSLMIVNRARHQARYRNAATQYFHWLFNDSSTSWSYPGESMRVIYAESLGPKEEASDELATILIDAGASIAFFEDPWRLSEDILSNGAAGCIKRLPDADRLHR
jgi:hypothetical protein